MNENRLGDYLDHMKEAATLALSYVKGMSRADFLADTRTQQAVILNLFVIGEAATKLIAEYPDFAQQHASIGWKSMKGMRNRIAHGYFDVDLDIVWETVATSLPELLNKLSGLGSQQSV
jgi:uncharacterized protein with HEPN domain